jgi:biotin carboxyl carrier protein
MSLYYVTIGKNEYRGDLNGTQAKVNGKLLEGNLRRRNGSGLHLLQREKQTLELFLDAQQKDTLEILVGSRRVLAKVETLPQRLTHARTEAESNDLRSPMPGLIVKVGVSDGNHVEQGQTLVLLESMKMQMHCCRQQRLCDASDVLTPGQQ